MSSHGNRAADGIRPLPGLIDQRMAGQVVVVKQPAGVEVVSGPQYLAMCEAAGRNLTAVILEPVEEEPCP